MTTDKI